ncbi:MYG1 exonuclease-like isoform X3 [Amphibalanus amphitrite]|uniref:MYG1 exonuclease-like isoform X3 n=1 Tax=Amphibalanus amphitrite TaxID=1232801 RepID=UPI001C92B0A1|nr:MYG1 exonuclease-like isoform X3 [Amphibalanus amphitrite]
MGHSADFPTTRRRRRISRRRGPMTTMVSEMKKFKKAVHKIGTHNGTFHCDEVLAVSMLKMLPECQDAEIIRSRDEDMLKECDIVVDVGAVYDPDNHRYDHHQKSFTETMQSVSGGRKPWTTRLSSAGLVYHHFGRDVLAARLGDAPADTHEVLYDRLYQTFVEEIDAVDNGINQYDGTPRYQVTSTIGARVSRLNPAWNDPEPDERGRFERAMALVTAEFGEALRRLHTVWLPARQLVEAALRDRHRVHPSGLIAELPAGGAPWKDHLFTLEQQLEPPAQVMFMLYTDQNGNWRVQTVPPFVGSFDMRVPLKKSWRGLRDDELSKESGISGCVFVHASGFIGGAKSRESVLEMALQSLREADKL